MKAKRKTCYDPIPLSPGQIVTPDFMYRGAGVGCGRRIEPQIEDLEDDSTDESETQSDDKPKPVDKMFKK